MIACDFCICCALRSASTAYLAISALRLRLAIRACGGVKGLLGLNSKNRIQLFKPYATSIT
jgi:hypothetical protein